MKRFAFDTVDSTNEVAKRMVRDGRLSSRAIITAREQTAGRGTRGRSWSSPRDAGIYMTAVDFVRPVDWSLMTQCTRAASIACAASVRTATGVDVGLKPVNDLILHGRKLGGVLVEALKGDQESTLLTGVGINLRTAPHTIDGPGLPAIALEDALGPIALKHLEIGALVDTIASSIFVWNERIAAGDLGDLELEWENYVVNCTLSADAAPSVGKTIR